MVFVADNVPWKQLNTDNIVHRLKTSSKYNPDVYLSDLSSVVFDWLLNMANFIMLVHLANR